MAKKRYSEQKWQVEREQKMLSAKKKLRIFPFVSLVVAGILLLLMLSHWVAIYNSDIQKNEIEVSGFNCVAAALSGNYKSADVSAFGNMAVFQYHAEAYIVKLSVITVVAMFLVIAHLLVQLFAVITNKQKVFNLLAILFALAETAIFIACYVVALSFRDSGILTTYCRGNKACSIRSQAILPVIFALLSLASPILAFFSERKIKLQFEPAAEKAKEEEKGALGKGKGAANKGAKKR